MDNRDKNNEHKCVVCGKIISTYYYPEWAYKGWHHGKLNWYCGYVCMRKFQKRHERVKTLPVEE